MSTQTKHTPAPWQAVYHDKELWIEDDNGAAIAHLPSWIDDVSDHKEANATFIVEAVNNYERLKASNAELLEALKLAVADYEIAGAPLRDALSWAAQARAAISKAEGR